MTAESTSPTSDQKYIAIIGDLRHSRRAEDRADLQRRLLAAIDELKSKPDFFAFFESMFPEVKNVAATALPVAATLTAGDEVQALLTSGFATFRVLYQLTDAVSPASMTFGLGFGTVSTDLSDNVALVDGPVFHNARDALAVARQKGFWCAAKGFGEDDAIVTALLSMVGALRSRWTERQDEFIEMILQEELKRIQIARNMDVSPSVVSESLRAAAFEEFAQGTIAGVQIIDRHLRGTAP